MCQRPPDRVESATLNSPAPLIFQVTAMFSRDLTLARYDADLYTAMEQEAQRQ